MPIYTGGKVRLNPLANAKLMRTLYEGSHSIAELIEATGLGERSVITYLIHLRKLKLVRIGSWDTARNGAATIPCFEWAPDKRDVPKPVKSVAQRSKEYRARKILKEIANGLANQTQTG